MNPTGSCPLRLARHVVFTRLPFGGGVLVNGATLALTEFSERDAEIIDRLLNLDGAGWGRVPTSVRPLVAELADARWVVAAASADDPPFDPGDSPDPAPDHTRR